MAYQIAFDLYEGATQQFLSSVISVLKATVPFMSGNETASSDGSAEAKADKNGTADKSGLVTWSVIKKQFFVAIMYNATW